MQDYNQAVGVVNQIRQEIHKEIIGQEKTGYARTWKDQTGSDHQSCF